MNTKLYCEEHERFTDHTIVGLKVYCVDCAREIINAFYGEDIKVNEWAKVYDANSEEIE